VQDGLKRGPE